MARRVRCRARRRRARPTRRPRRLAGSIGWPRSSPRARGRAAEYAGARMTDAKRGYADLHEHLDALRRQGLLVTVDRPIDKDAELHPLVRWQFVGGLPEQDRKAFLFTNVTDGRGRTYTIPVVVGAIAANRAIYSIGMGVPLAEIQARWDHAIANPIAPRIVDVAPCHEIVVEGAA